MKSLLAAGLLCLAWTPAMAANLKSDLIEIEKRAWTAWGKGDAATYTQSMTDDAVMAVTDDKVLRGKKEIAANVASHGCQLKSFAFTDTAMRQLTPDIAVLSYTATQDATCDGEKLPAKLYATAIYLRQSGNCRWISYQETPIK
jgi:uncharacterized protein (TIGR02246 family)